MDNYMLRASDNSIYCCVPYELQNELMPVIPIKTVIVFEGYLVFIKPKKYLTLIAKELLN